MRSAGERSYCPLVIDAMQVTTSATTRPTMTRTKRSPRCVPGVEVTTSEVAPAEVTSAARARTGRERVR